MQNTGMPIQHTLEPWIVASKESGHDVHYDGWLVTSEGGDIAQAINPYETFSFDKPELFAKGELIQQANARLIAAAPDLLKALEKLTAAFALDGGTGIGRLRVIALADALKLSHAAIAKARP